MGRAKIYYHSGIDKEKVFADIQEQEQKLVDSREQEQNRNLISKIKGYMGYCPPITKNNLVQIGNVDFYIATHIDTFSRTTYPALYARVMAENSGFIKWITGRSHRYEVYYADSIRLFKGIIGKYG